MKHIYKYLMIIVSIISIIIFTFASMKDVSIQSLIPLANVNISSPNGDALTPKEDILYVTDIVSVNSKYPLNNIYKVANEKANLFSLSYIENNLQKGSTLKLSNSNKNISNQIYAILKASYPNISLGEMGLSTEEEAYQAEQLAIWEVAHLTKEAKHGSEFSRIQSIKADMGSENINEKVFSKAKELRDLAIKHTNSAPEYKENISDNLKLYANNGQVKIFNLDVNGKKNYVVGPITYEIEEGIVTNSEIVITDSIGGDKLTSVLVNSEGVEQKNIKPNTEFYIAFPDYPKEAVTITANITYKMFVPSIYECEGEEYIANTYLKKESSNSLTIEF
ncbi:MAG: thioester domain-containing protein [Clostridia bacterium]|nr:thioester domain-containing protein [Clostridia bacterium]